MNTEKIQALLNVIEKSPLILVDDSPYLHSCDISDLENSPENQVLCFRWTDSEGLEFSVKFTEAGLDKAEVFGNKILLLDHEGEPSEILLFDLTPICIDIEIGKQQTK